MAKLSVFQSYGKPKKNLGEPVSVNVKKQEEITIPVSLEELASNKTNEQVVEVKLDEQSLEQQTKAVEPVSTVKKAKKGRPPMNPDFPSVVKTYKLIAASVNAMEETFFENRNTWSSDITYSKYISNLIWRDTHNGQDLFDLTTGEIIVKK